MTIILYIATFLLTVFSITQLIRSLICKFFIRLSIPYILSNFISSIITWLLIDLMWFLIEKNHIPILALGISIVTIYLRAFIQRKKLTREAEKIMVSEIWAIIILGLIIILGPTTRWI